MNEKRDYVVSVERREGLDPSIGIRESEGYTEEMVNIGVKVGQGRWYAGYYVQVSEAGEPSIHSGICLEWDWSGKPHHFGSRTLGQLKGIILKRWQDDMQRMAWEAQCDKVAAEAMPY